MKRKGNCIWYRIRPRPRVHPRDQSWTWRRWPEGDLKRAVHSEMILLQSLLAKKVIDPSNFRERTQGAWEMIGVVSALFLTMDKYCDPVEIYDEELMELVPFCHQIHPFCAGTATLFAASSVVLSMILYCQISFVPDQFLGDWMFALARCVDLPVLCFIVSVICWCLDLVWIGIVIHGTFGVIFGGLVMIPAACILLLYVKVKSLTNKFLLRAAMVWDATPRKLRSLPWWLEGWNAAYSFFQLAHVWLLLLQRSWHWAISTQKKKVASRIDLDFIRISSYNHPIAPSQWITLWLGNPTNQRFWWGNLDLVEKIKPVIHVRHQPHQPQKTSFSLALIQNLQLSGSPRSQNS